LCCIRENENGEDIDPLEVSSLCRLFKAFLEDTRIGFKNSQFCNFYKWIKLIYTDKMKITKEAKDILVWEKDFITMKEILNLRKTLKNNLYKEAIIYGLRFKSRGVPWKEFNAYCTDYSIIQNRVNTLEKFWNVSNSFSAWFKCRVYDDNYKESDAYGQFNFFFDIPIFTHDKFISNLHYASTFMRKFKTCNQLDYLFAKETEDWAYTNNHKFIHLINVYSTVFAVGVKGKNDENDFEFVDPRSNNYNIIEADTLYFIPIYRHRMKIKINENRLFIEENESIKKKFFFCRNF
jgi:hypothetical protein